MDKFLFKHMAKIIVLFPILAIIVIVILAFQAEREIEECGGWAKCAGKTLKDVKKDFKEGLNEE